MSQGTAIPAEVRDAFWKAGVIGSFRGWRLPQRGAELGVERVDHLTLLDGALGPIEFGAFGEDGGVVDGLAFEFGALGLFAVVLRPAHQVVAAGFEGRAGDAGASVGFDSAETGAGLGLNPVVENGEEGLAKLGAEAVGLGAGAGFAFGFIDEVFAEEHEVLPDVGGDGLIQRREYPCADIWKLSGEGG